jgi:hypothetical protein
MAEERCPYCDLPWCESDYRHTGDEEYAALPRADYDALVSRAERAEADAAARGRLLDEHRKGCEWKARAERAEAALAKVRRMIESDAYRAEVTYYIDAILTPPAAPPSACPTCECGHAQNRHEYHASAAEYGECLAGINGTGDLCECLNYTPPSGGREAT